jgi:hypothetical protein
MVYMNIFVLLPVFFCLELLLRSYYSHIMGMSWTIFKDRNLLYSYTGFAVNFMCITQ